MPPAPILSRIGQAFQRLRLSLGSTGARLLAVSGGLALMAGGQLLLEDRQRPNFWLAYGLLLVGAIVAAGALPPLEKGKRAQPDPGEPAATATTRGATVPTLAPHIFIAAFLFSGAALLALRRADLAALGIALWLLSLSSFLLAWWLKSPRGGGTARAPSWYGPAIAASLLLALALRVYRLDEVPPFVHGDEAQFGILARDILAGDVAKALTVGFHAHPALGYQPYTLGMALFGDNLIGLRMGSVLVGLLTVLFTAKLAEELYGHGTAALAAALAAVSIVLLHFGRVGLSGEQTSLVLAATLYLLLRAVGTGHLLWYALWGLALGTGLQTHWGARIAPVVAVLVLIGGAFVARRWRSRAHLRGLAVALAGAFLGFAPLGAFYLAHPSLLAEHEGTVFIFSPQVAGRVAAQYGAAAPPEILARQAMKVLGAFHRGGDTATQFGWQGPLLDPFSAPLLLVGALLAIRRPGTLANMAALLAIGAVIATGGLLAIEQPWYQRLITLLPPTLVLTAVAAWRIAGLLHAAFPLRLGSAAALPLAGFLGLSGFANVEGYFAIYAPSTAGHLHTEIARHMERTAGGYRFFGLMSPNVSVRYETSQFLARGAEAQDLRDLAQAPPVPRPEEKGLSFLLFAERADHLAALRRLYPGGTAIRHPLRGDAYFVEYRVEPGAG